MANTNSAGPRGPRQARVADTNPRERIRGPWGVPLGWVRRILRDGLPYLNRYSLRKQGPSGTNPWRVYLHSFMAPDGPGHHNHPSAWSFSIVLWGSYTEEILEFHQKARVWPETPWGSVVRTCRVRWFNWIAADRYHRIAELHPGPGARGVITLFVCGPLTGRGWGFWRAGIGHVPVEVDEKR